MRSFHFILFQAVRLLGDIFTRSDPIMMFIQVAPNTNDAQIFIGQERRRPYLHIIMSKGKPFLPYSLYYLL